MVLRRLATCLMLANAVGCTAPSPAATPPQAREAAPASAGTADLSSVVGVWRGTSRCTVRPSSCNDEVAVYYFSGTDRDHILWVANKIVDGKEEEMGRSECQLLPAEHRLTCRMERGTFAYAIDGN